MSDLKDFNKYFEGSNKKGFIFESTGNDELDKALSMSDKPIKIGDYVIPFDKEGLKEGSVAYLNSKKYFKVINVIKDEIDIGHDFTFKTKRFKKVELSGNINVGDIVVIADSSKKTLDDDVYEYLISKPYFEVISSRKTKDNKILLDIGYRDENGEPYWYSYHRFLASKPMSELVFKQFEDERKYIEENIDKVWIDPEKMIIAKIQDLGDNSINFESIDIEGKRESSMTIKRFVEYFYILGKEHLDFVNNKIQDLENKKREDIQTLIAKYEKPYNYYDGIIKLIKKHAE